MEYRHSDRPDNFGDEGEHGSQDIREAELDKKEVHPGNLNKQKSHDGNC